MPNLRLALRTLFKTPFVTAVAILSLSLGIGANSAIFSLFNQMLLRPLPVPQPETLVNLGAPGPKPGSQSCSNAGGCDVVFSYPMYRDLERVQTSFTGLAAHRNFNANIGYKGTTLNGEGLLVSGSYFPVLTVSAALGRLFTPDDDKTIGAHLLVVLSHEYWRRRFDMNPGVLNESLIINGQAMTVVGVAPPGFTGTTLGASPDVFVPITMRGLMQPGFNAFENRRSYWVYAFARLKPGVTIDQARVAINGPYKAIVNDVEVPLQKGMSEQTMARFKVKEVTLDDGRRGQSDVDSEARTPLLVLFAVTGTVLLIACANIANLLLVRGAGRAAEMAVRLSIGASRRQLILQLLMESCLLAALGALGGLVVARWTLDLISSILPADAGNLITFTLDTTMVTFALLTAVVTGIAFGLFPALHSTRPDLATTLKNQAGQPGGAKTAARFRVTLATVQIAMSMALLVPAGLFAKSLFNVSRVNLGLRIDHLVTFAISPELNGYSTERTRELFQRLEDELAAMPGVTNAVAAMVPVLAGDNWNNSLVVEGFEAGPDTNTTAAFNGIGPDYFKTMGIPLIGGREFTRSDAIGAPKVAIVNQALARKFNLGENPLGKRFGLGGPNAKPDIEIVGLAYDAKYSEVKRVVPAQYLPAVPPGRAAGVLVLLRENGVAARTARVGGAGADAEARSQPSCYRVEDDGDAGAGERVPGSVDQHALVCVCDTGDGASRGRSVRCAGIYGCPADTGVRSSYGARRRRDARAQPGDAAGDQDGDYRRCCRPGCRRRRGPRRAVTAVRDARTRSLGTHGSNDCARHCRNGRRFYSRAPRLKN